jgi:hypothetical protein
MKGSPMDIGTIQSMVHQLVKTFARFDSQRFVMEKSEDFAALELLCDAGKGVAVAGKKALADGILDAGEAHSLEQAMVKMKIAMKHFALEVKDITEVGGTGREAPPDPDDPTPS